MVMVQFDAVPPVLPGRMQSLSRPSTFAKSNTYHSPHYSFLAIHPSNFRIKVSCFTQAANLGPPSFYLAFLPFLPPSSFIPFEISGFARLASNRFIRLPSPTFFFAACESLILGFNAASSVPAVVSFVPDLVYLLELGLICVRPSWALRCGLGWRSGSWSFSAGWREVVERGGRSSKEVA